MIVTDDAITELEHLLREERDAIRTLDGTKVLAFAQRKEFLMALVKADDAGNTPERQERIRALVPALRQNGVLLAHARDILNDALVAIGAAPRTHTPRAAATAPRRILSVRG